MGSVQGDISIGVRAFELVSATGNVAKEMRRLGIKKSKAYEWANGRVPSGRTLQTMAFAGYDVLYILMGGRKDND